MLFILVTTGIIGVIITTLVVLKRTNVFDETITTFIIQSRHETITKVMHFFTKLGKEKPTGIICMLLIAVPDTRETTAFPVGVAVLLTGFITIVFKRKVARIRPKSHRLVEEKDHSFPSAHATTAATLYGGILMNIHLIAAPLYIGAVIGAVLLIFCIGYSRIYLGIHYPSDVIGGWCLGLFFTSLCTVILK